MSLRTLWVYIPDVDMLELALEHSFTGYWLWVNKQSNHKAIFFLSHTSVTRCFEAPVPGQSLITPLASPQVGSAWEQEPSSIISLTQTGSKHIYGASILCPALGEVLGSSSLTGIIPVLRAV